MENSKMLRNFGILVVISIMLLSVGCSSGESSGSSSSDKKNEEKVEKTYHIGDVVVVDTLEYTVNSISTSKSVGSEYLSADSKGTFLIINVTVKNNGDKELFVDDTLFKLINGSKQYENDSTAGIYANESGTFFLETVNPDLSSTGNVVFDISDETISSPDLQLQVKNSMMGSKQELIYLNK